MGQVGPVWSLSFHLIRGGRVVKDTILSIGWSFGLGIVLLVVLLGLNHLVPVKF